MGTKKRTPVGTSSSRKASPRKRQDSIPKEEPEVTVVTKTEELESKILDTLLSVVKRLRKRLEE